MATKEEALVALAKAMEAISGTIENVVENQNNTWKEVNKQQLDLLRYQCEMSNQLIGDMLQGLKKEKN